MNGASLAWVRPVRASLPKTKSGCLTCKKRHVKCTEERPTCGRCQKANRLCEYASGTSEQKPRPKLHIRFQHCHVAPSVSLPSVIFNSEIERYGFECFWHRTSESLSPALGWSDWGRVVLQHSEQDAIVRHAMVGLGAIHDHHYQTKGYHQDADKPELLDFSYSQYGKAIRQLRDRIQAANNVAPTTVMLVCTLFAIFDFLHGDDQAALAHLKAGITMLKGTGPDAGVQRSSTSAGSHSSPRSMAQIDSAQFHLQDCLTSVFSHLDFFSLWWSNGESLMPDVSLGDDPFANSASASSTNMTSLLTHYSGLESRVHQFLRAAQTRNRGNALQSYADLRSAKSELLSELEEAFSCFCRLHDQESEDENRKGQLVLRLNFDILRIMLFACRYDAAPDYRPFNSDFDGVVATASTLSRDIWPARIQFQSFRFAHGLIYPLYIASTCCCDLMICQRAIDTLESFRWSEGVWNGKVMAKIARRKLKERVQGPLDKHQT